MSNKRSNYINKTVELDNQVEQVKQDTVKKEYEAKMKNVEAKANKKVAEAENKAAKETKKAKSHKLRNTLLTITAIAMLTGGAVLYHGKNDVEINKDPSDDTKIVIKEDDTDNNNTATDNKEEVIVDYDYLNRNNGGKKTNNGTYDAHGKYTDSNGNLKDGMKQSHESSKTEPSASAAKEEPANVGTQEGQKSSEEYNKETDDKINNQVQNGGQKQEIGGGITVVTTPDNGNTTNNNTNTNTTTPKTEDKSHVDATNITPDTSRKVTGNVVEAPSDPEPTTKASTNSVKSINPSNAIEDVPTSASSTNTTKDNSIKEMSDEELEEYFR